MKDQIIALRKEGKTYSQIAIILQCSKGTIAYHCGEGQHEKFISRNSTRRKVIRQWLSDYKNNFAVFDVDSITQSVSISITVILHKKI